MRTLISINLPPLGQMVEQEGTDPHSLDVRQEFTGLATDWLWDLGKVA